MKGKYFFITIVFLVIAASVSPSYLFPSAGRQQGTVSGTSPKGSGNVLRPPVYKASKFRNSSGDMASIPEGTKTVLTGKLIMRKDRVAFKSSETGMEFIILENSLLEQMKLKDLKEPGTEFTVTVRVTLYNKTNYIIIIKYKVNN